MLVVLRARWLVAYVTFVMPAPHWTAYAPTWRSTTCSVEFPHAVERCELSAPVRVRHRNEHGLDVSRRCSYRRYSVLERGRVRVPRVIVLRRTRDV